MQHLWCDNCAHYLNYRICDIWLVHMAVQAWLLDRRTHVTIQDSCHTTSQHMDMGALVCLAAGQALSALGVGANCSQVLQGIAHGQCQAEPCASPGRHYAAQGRRDVCGDVPCVAATCLDVVCHSKRGVLGRAGLGSHSLTANIEYVYV
jgi:hypothetical protein